MTDQAKRNENRSTTPVASAFRDYISGQWAEPNRPAAKPDSQVAYCAGRRQKLSSDFKGMTLVFPAGSMQVRSYDTFHPYRAHSAFTYYSGWAAETVPGALLVLTPNGHEHDATIFYRFPAGRGTEEFYSDPDIGEFWVGPRPTPEDVAVQLGMKTRSLGEIEELLSHADSTWAVVREADDIVTGLIDKARGKGEYRDDELHRFASEQRLVKDDFEIAEIRKAVAATALGFNDVLGNLDEIRAHSRGERVIEGRFNTRARSEGNQVGYETIAAAGPHACILHWTRNDGQVKNGDLVLLDAGVEVESLYTADITRTFPVSGKYSEVQRMVHDAVQEAADAAFAVVKPGIVFSEVHAAAIAVIARKVSEWGFLPVSLEESMAENGQQHRRYMVHGTSHHLGLDVHDCGQARKEFYKDGIVQAGMVFTIEPGLYFQPDDLTVPERFRGIGVRIEDNILVTKDGAENLSAGIPRSASEIEKWIGSLA